MNKYIMEFITELNRLGIASAFPQTQVDVATATHLFAWVEQKVNNEHVRYGRREGQCPVCGGEM